MILSFRTADILDMLDEKVIGTVDIYVEGSDIDSDTASATVFYTGPLEATVRKMIIGTSVASRYYTSGWIKGRTDTKFSTDNFFYLLQAENLYASGNDNTSEAAEEIIQNFEDNGFANKISEPIDVGIIDTLEDPDTEPVNALHYAHFDVSEDQVTP